MPSMISADSALLDALTALASRAAAAILAAVPGHRVKADRSPVTAADEAAEAVILEGLIRILPGVPVISEEAVARGEIPALADTFVLVDPLDGTREFLDGLSEYTVNIAVVTGGIPVMGVVAAPPLSLVWRGMAGAGAERLGLAPGAPSAQASERVAIHPRPAPSRLVATVSRSHPDAATDAFIAGLPGAERVVRGSSVKFCCLAEGSADVYPRLVPPMEWDIAAGHAILAAAGGVVLQPDGSPLRYGRAADAFRAQPFIAWGDPSAADRYRGIAAS